MDGSSLPGTIIESDYKLAYKFFLNKNFESSYELITKLYSHSFKSFTNETINESLFVKIIKLYLTEIGLFVNPSNKLTLTLSKSKRSAIVKDIQDQTIMEDLLKVYLDLNKIPSEIILNLYLVYYSVRDLVNDPNFVYSLFLSLVTKLDLSSPDSHLRKLVHIYVFQVLAEDNKFDEARMVVKTNPVFHNKLDEYMAKLDSLQNDKLNESKLASQRAKERETQQKEREALKQKEHKEKHDLHFRSLKQIRDLQQNEVSPKSSPKETVKEEKVATLTRKVMYLYELTKDYVKENSPVILVVILAAFLTSRFINVKKINVKEKLKETIGMAFKISYL